MYFYLYGEQITPVYVMPRMIAVFWFRRDLRLEDNAALHQALKGPLPVLPVFIFDRHILDELRDRKDARAGFIHTAVAGMKNRLEDLGGTIQVYYDKPEIVWPQIIKNFPVGAVYTNRDYEPYAQKRDIQVENLLRRHNIPFYTAKDHVIFESDEVLKDDGTPYTVFTPYSRKWLTRLDARRNPDGQSFYLGSYPSERYLNNLFQTPPAPLPTLGDMGFEPSDLDIPSVSVAQGLIRNYDKTRDFPALNGTSRLGVHFRFGTISIREKARKARALNATFLNELIWRDFYSQILAHFPHVAERSFKPQYDRIAWRNNLEEFERWKLGKTGYPIVDAGMRELLATGYMHNRVRMIVASFLTKHLLIDWRWGEAWFAEKLLDFDLASNNGGWQWAAGCGTDAAPYFRIFNPSEQTKKFDPQFEYIRRWVPEFGRPEYAKPVVDHAFARQRCLDAYKTALT